MTAPTDQSSATGRAATPAIGITREALERDAIRAAMRTRHPEVPLLDQASLHASIDATLAARPAGAAAADGVWLFGYGSLLWNPCVAVAEWSDARLHGFHRDFRLRLTYGRGSPEAPGLMLGLVAGGSCRGMALRVPARNLRHELLMVWRREMLTGAYRPRWVRLRTPGGPLWAVTFVVNRRNRCFCGRLDDAEVVRLIATGHGLIGSSADYLDNTVAHLDAQGIHDRRLRALRARVAGWRRRPG